MPRLHLVRHGRAAASWTDHLDPGLDETGAEQARSVARDLGSSLAPRAIWSSPLLRTQETAAPLAAAWSTTIALSPAFGEVPSPSADPGERGAWLASAMVSRWSDLGPAVEVWRSRLLAAVGDAAEDIVVFTHFVAINAVVAAVEDRPEVMVFAPANGSITVIDTGPPSGRLTVVDRGAEAAPEIR
ncbi:histidine phosphatase family protein [Aquihabitans daechungensis]|uniref:histidine phosphatase family protein n=1 Tax=Aquihabitans daechungensis TaxID=1052257 RepID=UPI003BA386D6